MDFLEYSDITAEIKGCMTPGKLKMTDQNIVFKNSKTGKVEQIPATDFEIVNFQNFAGTWGLRLFLKNGTLHRFVGFKDSDKEKIAKFFTSTYKIDMLEKELSLKGWNWGTAKFSGSILNFEIGNNSAFEIPLNHVSQCSAGKNEVTMEFHQNDDAPVSLMEMRFFVPTNEMAGDVDPVEAFQQNVMNKASVINVSGDAIAIFREMQCLTPRGRYDIKIFQSFFQLHGKTFDYKIPISTVLRLFLLPHKDGRQMFFVVSLDPPIKQGQTRYHFLVLVFNNEETTSIELPFSEAELKEKYEGKLEKELSGPTYEVLGKVMKCIIVRKLTGPGAFVGHSGTPAIGCSYKAAAGYLYPLERGFIYVHKPPIHIRFEEIASVNFARGGGNTRTFDFEVELKSLTIHTFSSIEKEEYTKLYDFITSKKLNIKNRGKSDKASYKDDFGNSDDEAAPDAYLERVKAEAQERYDDDQSDEDESTDEDFDPGQAMSDVAEEFDSEHSSSSDDDASGSGGDHREKKHKDKKKKSAKTVSEKPRKSRKDKKSRDDNKPKRPSTAFMIWLNEHREKIKSENPGIKVTEIAKKGGEMWRELKDKSEWDSKAGKEKEKYNKAMEAYKASGGGGGDEKKSSSKPKKDSKPAPKKKPAGESTSPGLANKEFKSKEYISDDDSSSDEDKKKKSPKKPDKKPSKKDSSDEDQKKKKDDNKKKPSPKKSAKKDDSDEDASSAESSDEDKKKKKTDSKKPPPKKPAKKDESDEDEESDEESSEDEKKKKGGAKRKREDSGSKKSKKRKEESDEEEDMSSEATTDEDD